MGSYVSVTESIYKPGSPDKNVLMIGIYCLKCYEGIIRVISVSNEELYQTTHECKIKFTVDSKKTFPNRDLIDQLNDAMDDQYEPVTMLYMLFLFFIFSCKTYL